MADEFEADCGCFFRCNLGRLECFDCGGDLCVCDCGGDGGDCDGCEDCADRWEDA